MNKPKNPFWDRLFALWITGPPCLPLPRCCASWRIRGSPPAGHKRNPPGSQTNCDGHKLWLSCYILLFSFGIDIIVCFFDFLEEKTKNAVVFLLWVHICAKSRNPRACSFVKQLNLATTSNCGGFFICINKDEAPHEAGR